MLSKVTSKAFIYKIKLMRVSFVIDKLSMRVFLHLKLKIIRHCLYLLMRLQGHRGGQNLQEKRHYLQFLTANVEP